MKALVLLALAALVTACVPSPETACADYKDDATVYDYCLQEMRIADQEAAAKSSHQSCTWVSDGYSGSMVCY